jgi:NADH-quinone oxidoreductase subunit L
MNLLALVVLAPLAAAALIPFARRAPAALALLGAGMGLIASLWLLADAFDGVHHTLILPGLPDMPLRLISEPLNALLSVMVGVVGASCWSMPSAI